MSLSLGLGSVFLGLIVNQCHSGLRRRCCTIFCSGSLFQLLNCVCSFETWFDVAFLENVDDAHEQLIREEQRKHTLSMLHQVFIVLFSTVLFLFVMFVMVAT